MKHKGKATRAALKLILGSLLGVLVAIGIAVLLARPGIVAARISSAFFSVWAVFALFCIWFFRDPDPAVPEGPEAIVAPAHGKVDAIEESTELEFLGGRCWRISIFLSVIEVHVQRSPVTGTIAHFKHSPGQFLSALKSESATHNENVLIGFDSSEKPGEKVAVRLIAGVIARRILPWITVGDRTARGERISLIQFGSRVDLYLPQTAKVLVRLGDTVRGGETVVATRA